MAKIITYKTSIYSLYKEICVDEDLDVVSFLKEKDDAGDLEGLTKNEVSEIYLFFDYDPHNSNANNEKIHKLLAFFCDETEKGKLYINYPMLEVFRHNYKLIKAGKDFEVCNSLSYSKLKEYKSEVSKIEPEIKHIDCVITIRKLINDSLCFGHKLITEKFCIPKSKSEIEQEKIFNKQRSLFVSKDEHPFYLISGIPFFLYEYNKETEFLKFLSGNASK
jgi:hypothetical protein